MAARAKAASASLRDLAPNSSRIRTGHSCDHWRKPTRRGVRIVIADNGPGIPRAVPGGYSSRFPRRKTEKAPGSAFVKQGHYAKARTFPLDARRHANGSERVFFLDLPAFSLSKRSGSFPLGMSCAGVTADARFRGATHQPRQHSGLAERRDRRRVQ